MATFPTIRRLLLALPATMSLCMGSARAQEIQFEALDFLDPDAPLSQANDVSSDGTVIVGWASLAISVYQDGCDPPDCFASFAQRAVRWTDGSIAELAALPDPDPPPCCDYYSNFVSGAYACSPSGDIAGGLSSGHFFDGWEYYKVATRWIGNGPADGLEFPPCEFSCGAAAFCISDGGTALAGGLVGNSPAVWRADGSIQGLSELSGAVMDMAADGMTLVGYIEARPVRWAFGGGQWSAQYLQPDPGITGFAEAISADGTVIVGHHYDGLHAFRYTDANGFEVIDPPKGAVQLAHGVRSAQADRSERDDPAGAFRHGGGTQ